MSRKENNNKVVYKCRDISFVREKNGQTYTRFSNWRYYYGVLPKNEEVNYTNFNTFIDNMTYHAECWCDMYVGETIFRHRPYIAIWDDAPPPDCSIYKVFEKDFLKAQHRVEYWPVERMNIHTLSEKLSYNDFIDFCKDKHINFILK